MLTIPVIFEDDDLLIVNKPCNVSFHNETSHLGIFSILKQQRNCALWPVHRLDKMTSGLLIFAKKKTAAAHIGNLFETKVIQKTYIAISDKKPKKKQGLIQGDMQKARSGSWRLSYELNNPARTNFISTSLAPRKRLFVINPETGKTHQIRVALKSLGSPIIGDERYGGTKSDRGYLHAFRLSFEWHNNKVEFECLPHFGKHFLSDKNLSDKISLLS